MNEIIPSQEFKPKLHQAFLKRCLGPFPSHYSGQDTTRVILLFFTLSGMDVLNELDHLKGELKTQIVNWLYSLQVIATDGTGGFQSSSTLNKGSAYKSGHIAATYSSLIILLMLDDDLSRVNRQSIIGSLKHLQLEDGSFKATPEGTENDMRFVFCAAAISYILNDFSAINLDTMSDFILKSISYEGGMGQGPELEAHCGSTFCGLASLALTSQLHRIPHDKVNFMRKWLLNRLSLGFNGRPNKPSDTCYSFWTGGALKILDSYHFLDEKMNYQYVLMTQDKYGGFAKWPNTAPDPMHTYFGLAGLSIMKSKKFELEPMFCTLNVTEKTHQKLRILQEQWSKVSI